MFKLLHFLKIIPFFLLLYSGVSLANQVEVPDLRGESSEMKVEIILAAAGLSLGEVVGAENKGAPVIKQLPVPGEKVPYNTPVKVYLRK